MVEPSRGVGQANFRQRPDFDVWLDPGGVLGETDEPVWTVEVPAHHVPEVVDISGRIKRPPLHANDVDHVEVDA